MSSDELSTQTTAPPSSTAPDAVAQKQVRLRVAACSDKGLVRKNNEDRYLALKVTRSTTPVLTNIDAAQLQFVPEQTCGRSPWQTAWVARAAGEVASTSAPHARGQAGPAGTGSSDRRGRSQGGHERVETI
jgi:hypothetical protein